MRVILDTSVIVKWVITDEENSESALKLFEKLKNGEITIVAPYLLGNELVNVIRSGLIQKRISLESGILFLKLFSKFPIIYYDLSDYYAEIFAVSIKYTISGYDAAFIFLSELLSINFYSYDTRLIQKISPNHEYIHDLNEVNY